MEKQKLLRLFGAFVAVAMVFSIFATAFLYGPDDSEPNTNIDQSLQPSTFSYNISFEAEVLKELSSLRFSALTSHLDIQEIDTAIKDIEGVRRVDSSFQATQSEKWVYSAEITTKSGNSLSRITGDINSLEFFSAETDARKFVTVTTPDEPVQIKNEQLGLDKNYSFEAGTVSSSARVSTEPGDTVMVAGSISLQKGTIVKLDLSEAYNFSQISETDLNLPDTNSPKMQTSDANSPFSDGNVSSDNNE